MSVTAFQRMRREQLKKELENKNQAENKENETKSTRKKKVE